MTDNLIEKLVAEAKPVSAHALPSLLLYHALFGLCLALAIMVFVLGPRHDLAFAMTTASFWTKLGYASLLFTLLLPALLALSRPVKAGFPWLLVASLLGVLALIALFQVNSAEPDQRHALLWGATALVCPWLITLISMPVLISLLTAMRKLAPLKPALAGFAAGIFSGAIGVFVYSFHCPEVSIPFIAIWYTLGILITGIAGSVGGCLVLRW